jgi:hypothetical protein
MCGTRTIKEVYEQGRMKAFLERVRNASCREYPIGDISGIYMNNYTFVQNFFPGIELLQKSNGFSEHSELPSRFQISSLLNQEDDKIWKGVLLDTINNNSVEENIFIKSIHLLNPISMLRNEYVIPPHALIPQSRTLSWKSTLLQIHKPNNQAYVDALANYVLGCFRDEDLTPHCIRYYGSKTAIAEKYRYNISDEYETYSQTRWFWKGIKKYNVNIEAYLDDLNIRENNKEMYDMFFSPPENLDESDDEFDNTSMQELDIDSIGLDIPSEDVDVNSLHTYEPEEMSVSGDSDENENESFNNDDCSDATSEEEEDEPNIYLDIPNMPVILVYQEAQEGTMDDLLELEDINGIAHGTPEWEHMWIAWIWQIISVLTLLQSTISFTHNDLHTNNIVWRNTDKEFLYYRAKDGSAWKVPTYGCIFSIIDFGRAIFKLGDEYIISDDHYPENEAGGQYNFGPFYDSTKPKIMPSNSFDLSRLAISMLDGLYDETPSKKKGKCNVLSQNGSIKKWETISSLYNLLWSWTVDDLGKSLFEDEFGEEVYDDFELYVRISRDISSAVPKEQIRKPIFQAFKYKGKIDESEKVYSLGI